jgi:hypothetical protein
MSASRFDTGSLFPEFRVEMPEGKFTLPAAAVRIRRSGLEFQSPRPLPVWAEMTVCLAYGSADALCCSGVVVACDGASHGGYRVSLLFLNLPNGSEQQLQRMARSAVF